jgi:hypothetical protein
MAGAALDVDRRQVLAYRVAAQQLDRSTADTAHLAVLAVGIQDTPRGSARLSIVARTGVPAADVRSDAADSVALVWSVRGAPHLHRTADLTALAAALWPLSDADATARIAVTPIKEGARLGVAAFTAAAGAMHAVVRSPMPKGDVSTGVSARVPASLTYWCQPCAAQHISGGLFQQVGLPAGVQVVAGSGATTLAPIDGWPGVPSESVGAAGLVAAYLRLLGPATPADAAKFLGTTQTCARAAWPEGLAEVRVDGRRAWLPEDSVPELRSAARHLAGRRPAAGPAPVRLLPPSDPFLQTRDRALLVPDAARRAAVWRALSSPGACLSTARFWVRGGHGKTAPTGWRSPSSPLLRCPPRPSRSKPATSPSPEA